MMQQLGALEPVQSRSFITQPTSKIVAGCSQPLVGATLGVTPRIEFLENSEILHFWAFLVVFFDALCLHLKVSRVHHQMNNLTGIVLCLRSVALECKFSHFQPCRARFVRKQGETEIILIVGTHSAH
jgi:hypothetical protein